MFNRSDRRFLTALATAPSLATAARSLDVSPSVVSQRLARIEGHLHLLLAEREPQRLTVEGGLLVERARVILPDPVSPRSPPLAALLHALPPRAKPPHKPS